MTTLAIILAAGVGTRMGSPLPKVLHHAAGNSLLAHVMLAAERAELTHLAVVVAPDVPGIANYVHELNPAAEVHIQQQRLGTAHAVLAARAAITQTKPDRIIVLFGDSPLIRPSSIMQLLAALDDGSSVAVAGFAPSVPGGYGRLLMQGQQLHAIREVKDATPQEMQSRLVNGGLMAIRGDVCLDLLDSVGNANRQNEYYLTDIVELANQRGGKVCVMEIDESEVLGVNTPAELEQVDQVLRQRMAMEWHLNWNRNTLNQAQLFINGAWRPSLSGRTLEVIDPATETVFAQIAAANAADVDAAVNAARAAFDTGAWPRLPGGTRAQVLRNIGAGILARLDQLAALEVRDNGKPLPEARWDVSDAAACFEFYAGLAEQEEQRAAEVPSLPDPRFSCSVVREPVGVVGAIIPWNYPLLMAAWKVAPALAAGCTVVLKPSELASLSALQLAGIATQAGLPPGVLNVITGLGSVAGQALIEHASVDKLAFTGSLATGSKIMQVAAQDIKRVSLELGGKSPFIVFADSDIEKAVEWIMFGIFWNQGQVCSATSRMLIQRSIYPRLLLRLTEEAKRIVIGNGMHEGVQLGPLISRAQHSQVCAAIARGIAEGASLICGGVAPPHCERGYFIAPTILANVAADAWIWQEEVFGPVLCVMPFDTEEEALALANNSRYGLAAAVMSDDLVRCERVAKKLKAGIVWINCSQPTFVEAPWGGVKQSGLGRELGRWGFESYLETKQITRYDAQQPWGWYLKE